MAEISKKIEESLTDQLWDKFFGNWGARTILALLDRGAFTKTEIADSLGGSPSYVEDALKFLLEADFINYENNTATLKHPGEPMFKVSTDPSTFDRKDLNHRKVAFEILSRFSTHNNGMAFTAFMHANRNDLADAYRLFVSELNRIDQKVATSKNFKSTELYSVALTVAPVKSFPSHLLDPKEIISKLGELEIAARTTVHDLRSPMSALNFVLNSIPENIEGLEIAKLSLKRLNNIADDLHEFLTKKLAEKELNCINVNAAEQLVRDIIEEYQFCFPDISFQTNFSAENIGNNALHPNISPTILSRILSNTLDNSVREMNGSGMISIKTRSCPKGMALSIDDKPISPSSPIHPEAFADIGMGHGLGQKYIRERLKSCNGKFRFERTKSGYSVYLEFPFLTPSPHPDQY